MDIDSNYFYYHFGFKKDSGWMSLTFEDNLRNKYFIPSFLHLNNEKKKILENKKVIHPDDNIYFNMDFTIMGVFYRFYIDINNNSNNVKMSKSTLLKYNIFNKEGYYKSSIQMDNLIQ